MTTDMQVPECPYTPTRPLHNCSHPNNVWTKMHTIFRSWEESENQNIMEKCVFGLKLMISFHIVFLFFKSFFSHQSLSYIYFIYTLVE